MTSKWEQNWILINGIELRAKKINTSVDESQASPKRHANNLQTTTDESQTNRAHLKKSHGQVSNTAGEVGDNFHLQSQTYNLEARGKKSLINDFLSNS